MSDDPNVPRGMQELPRLIRRSVSGSIEWRVVELDRVDRIMLVATSPWTRFEAHFLREQWAEFQKLIAGS